MDFLYPPSQASIPGVATEATLLDVLTEAQAINTNTADVSTETTLAALNAKVTAVNTGSVTVVSSSLPTGAATESTLANVEAALSLTVVDQLDTPLLDTASPNIPASSGNPLEVVASTAATVREINIVDDIGAFYGIYTGAALSEVLLCVAPLGGGSLQVNIPSGTRISLRAMENTAISSGKVAINFLG